VRDERPCVGTSSISLASIRRMKARSFRCASFPHKAGFVGAPIGDGLKACPSQKRTPSNRMAFFDKFQISFSAWRTEVRDGRPCVGTSSISLASIRRMKARSFRCASFPHKAGFVGAPIGDGLKACPSQKRTPSNRMAFFDKFQISFSAWRTEVRDGRPSDRTSYAPSFWDRGSGNRRPSK